MAYLRNKETDFFRKQEQGKQNYTETKPSKLSATPAESPKKHAITIITSSFSDFGGTYK